MASWSRAGDLGRTYAWEGIAGHGRASGSAAPTGRGVVASWSVLHLSLTDLLDLSAPETDQLWQVLPDMQVSDLSIGPELLERLELRGLLADDGLDSLLSFSIEYLLRFFDRNDDFDAFLNRAVSRVALVVGRELQLSPASVSESSLLPIQDFAAARTEPAATVPPTTDRTFYRYVRGQGLTHLRDTAELSERGVIQKLGWSRPAFLVIGAAWRSIPAIEELVQRLCQMRTRSGAQHTLICTFRTALSESLNKRHGRGRTDRDVELLLSRSGIVSGRPQSLEDLGTVHGVTGMAIHNAVKRVLRDVDRAQLFSQLLPLYAYVYGLLCDHGGACDSIALADELSSVFEWSSSPSPGALGSALSFFSEFHHHAEEGFIHLTSSCCASCDALQVGLRRALEDSVVVTVDEAAERVAAGCSSPGNECPPLLGFSPLLLAALLDEDGGQTIALNVRNGLLVSRDESDTPLDSLSYFSAEILRRAGCAMHFSEVHEQLVAGRELKISPKTVYNRLV